MDKKNVPTVFVIEDDQALCESLRWLFSSIELNAEFYSNANKYLDKHSPNQYGCLLMDIRLPDMSGLKLQEHLIEAKNPLPIIFMTGYGDISIAVRAMKLGAKDFILKPFNNDFLLDQVQKVLVESHEIQATYQQFYNLLKKLTSREKQILQYVITGKQNKEISSELDITLSTVEQHRAHLMHKMETKSMINLIKKYFLVKSYITW